MHLFVEDFVFVTMAFIHKIKMTTSQNLKDIFGIWRQYGDNIKKV